MAIEAKDHQKVADLLAEGMKVSVFDNFATAGEDVNLLEDFPGVGLWASKCDPITLTLVKSSPYCL